MKILMVTGGQEITTPGQIQVETPGRRSEVVPKIWDEILVICHSTCTLQLTFSRIIRQQNC